MRYEYTATCWAPCGRCEPCLQKPQRHRRAPITAITLATLRFDPALATKLARRRNGVDVWSDGRVAFRLVIPSKPLTEGIR
jgi:hypothetical protein